MPLPHFLILVCAVVMAAGLTLWVAGAMGVPLAALAAPLLLAAAIAHLARRGPHHH